jgi:hypothetical protein
MRGPGLLVLLAAIASVGCSGQLSTEDAVGEDGKADQVDPHGHDNEGYLLVTTPPPSARGFVTPSLSYRSGAVQTAVKTRFANGTGCLGMYNSLMTDCAVKISAKQTTTYPLAAIYAHWDPATMAVDFGPEWTVQLTRNGTRLMSAIARAPFTQDALTLPGDFHVEFNGIGVFAPMDVTVAGGVAKDLDLTADKRATIHVIPPTSRSFATSPCSRQTLLIQRASSGVIADQMEMPAQSDASYRVFPFTAAETSHYEVSVGGIPTPLTLTVGQTVEFKVKRIDVNDVLVTREDGSTYYTKGTYVLSRQDPATGNYQPAFGGCVSPTSTGLDVAPGMYKISTSWTTADGADSEEDILDLR